MTSFITSNDGTRIAFDRLGKGRPIVIVGGIFTDRKKMANLAEHLATRCTVVNFDRRGRGESGNRVPYGVAREVEDIGALIAELGGGAALYGHSSGAGLALHAAAAGGLSIDHLILHEPPFGPSDEESMRGARELAEGIRDALASGEPGEAIIRFFTAYGLSAEDVAAMAGDAAMLKMAPTMMHDILVMGELDGGAIPETVARSVRTPTLVLAGGASPEFFRDTAHALAALMPDARVEVLEGADHGAPGELVAPVVHTFIGAS